MTTTRTRKTNPHDVYIGRSRGGDGNMGTESPGEIGWLGNPYNESEWGREKAIELFERDLEWMIEANPIFKAALLNLYGKTLGCYCYDHTDCHGDVLVKKINNLYWSSQ